MRALSRHQKFDLQYILRGIFDQFDLDVGVGITDHGLSIRSQDERIDAENITVELYTP